MTRLAGRLRQGHCLTYPRPAAADRDRPTSCLDADARRLRPGLLLMWILTFRAPSEVAEAADKTRREPHRAEEHTSELQSLMRISYADFCLNIKNTKNVKQFCHKRCADPHAQTLSDETTYN